MMIVAVAPSLIWPTKKPADRRIAGSADSVTARDSTRPAGQEATRPSAHPPIRPSADTGRIVWITSPLYRLGFSTRGGRLESAELLQYQSFAPGDSVQPVQLVPPGDAFLRHRLALPGGGTVSLGNWGFLPPPTNEAGNLLFLGQGQKTMRLGYQPGGVGLPLEYPFLPGAER